MLPEASERVQSSTPARSLSNSFAEPWPLPCASASSRPCAFSSSGYTAILQISSTATRASRRIRAELLPTMRNFRSVVYCPEHEFERLTRTNVSPFGERELERAACSVPASIIVAVRSPRLRRGCSMAGNYASPVVSAESKFLPVGNDGSRRISVNGSPLTTIHRQRRCKASEYLATGVARSFLSLYLCFVVYKI